MDMEKNYNQTLNRLFHKHFSHVKICSMQLVFFFCIVDLGDCCMEHY